MNQNRPKYACPVPCCASAVSVEFPGAEWLMAQPARGAIRDLSFDAVSGLKIGAIPLATDISGYGRIRRQKGTDVFVDAMLEVLPRHTGTTALVMGRAAHKHVPFLQGLREKVARAGLQDRILFLPEVPVEEMPRWYQALDLLVAPQRWEGFGLTPLEAMACSVPVIATTVGAFDELVVEGETGRLIPPGDVERMRAAVDAALASPATLQQWSAAARPHVEAGFRIEDEATALNTLYRELLDGREAYGPE